MTTLLSGWGLHGWSPRRAETVSGWNGAPLQAFDGLEAVYAELFRLETAIRDAVMFAAMAVAPGLRVEYTDTITDEDRLTVYKLFASRYQVEG